MNMMLDLPTGNLINEQAEKIVVGAVLARNELYDTVCEIITADHFSDPVLKRIWKWIVSCQSRQSPMPANKITLRRSMEKLSELDENHAEYIAAGEVDSYLKNLTAMEMIITQTAVVESNAHLVRDCAQRRTGVEIMSRAIGELINAGPETDPQNLIEATQDQLSSICKTGQGQKTKSLGEALRNQIVLIREAEEGIVGRPTGLKSLDEKLGGLRPGAVYLFAGRPGMGKSVMGWQIALNVAKQLRENKEKGVVLCLGYEMSAEEQASRYFADAANVSVRDQNRQWDKNDVWAQHRMAALEKTADEMFDVPMEINDSPPTNIAALAAYVRRIHREKGGVRLLMIDYVQLLGEALKGNVNREQVLSEISRGIKKLARELKFPVVSLAQLNRSVETRDDKRPQLADLRESGSLEQDADAVFMLYREEYYLLRAEPAAKQGESRDDFNQRYTAWKDACKAAEGRAEAIIVKMRQGEIGMVPLAFVGHLFKFTDIGDVP